MTPPKKSKEECKQALVDFIKEHFPALVGLAETDIIQLQRVIADLKAKAHIHPRIILLMIQDDTISQLEALARYEYHKHELSNRLMEYLGNSIDEKG